METVDGQILLFIQEHIRNAVGDVFFGGITHLGDAGIFWIVLTLVLLCFKQTRRAGIFSASALLGSLIINNMLLKNLIGRVRPYEVVTGLQCIVAPAVDASFPSGHTGASFASAVSMYGELPKKICRVPDHTGSADCLFQTVCRDSLSDRCAGRSGDRCCYRTACQKAWK